VTSGARPTVVEVAHSLAWPGSAPTIAALVSTFGRSGYLAELLAALEAQDLPRDELEVVIVDNGSADDTWEVVERLVAATPLRACGLRMDHNRGPAPGRNAGAAHVRAPLIAITDDDCLPTPTWLREVRAAFGGGADVLQGVVVADPTGVDSMAPWDHTIWVTAPTPFFETCNVAYRRTAFERAGGFDEDDPLLHPASGRAFGEDACLAWEVQRTGGGATFAPRAVVHHRCIPSDYAHWLADQRQLEGFPGLARRSPLVARWLYRGVFLDRRSAQFDLAVGGVAVALARRQAWPLVAVAPWLRTRWGNARHRARSRRGAPAVLARLAWSDTIALAAMVRGSIRHRRMVL
jgi:cellulose synthase/poly-beta-1,6-N-acetylglucosamine synthase-like glycosyltransferase